MVSRNKELFATYFWYPIHMNRSPRYNSGCRFDSLCDCFLATLQWIAIHSWVSRKGLLMNSTHIQHERQVPQEDRSGQMKQNKRWNSSCVTILLCDPGWRTRIIPTGVDWYPEERGWHTHCSPPNRAPLVNHQVGLRGSCDAPAT